MGDIPSEVAWIIVYYDLIGWFKWMLPFAVIFLAGYFYGSKG